MLQLKYLRYRFQQKTHFGGKVFSMDPVTVTPLPNSVTPCNQPAKIAIKTFNYRTGCTAKQGSHSTDPGY